jgi:N-sulfoglucosamine sulfohydrolase
VNNVDLFPALLEIAGAEVPSDIQGRSFLSLLRGEDFAPRDIVFAEKNTSANDLKRCVRTDRFKYIRNFNPGPELLLATTCETSLTRRDMGNDHLEPRPQFELYDLENDPTERRNLSGREEFSDVERKLAARLESIMRETDDPVFQGPIPRPEVEKETIQKAFDRAMANCRYPRDGLRFAFEESWKAPDSWEFADPTACG